MTMSGYLAALNGKYDHLQGEPFDWRSPDHAMRAVLSYLLACERQMGTDVAGEARALARAARLDAGDDAPLTRADAVTLQERLLFLHQAASPVARLLLELDDLHALPGEVRRGLLASEVTSLADFIAEQDRLLAKPEAADGGAAPTGGGQVAAIGKDDAQRIAARSAKLAGLTVASVTPIPGGMSKLTNRCTLVSVDGVETNTVMRIDTAAGYSTSSVMEEFDLLERLCAGGVAVPEPLAAGTLESGAAAILMAHAGGVMFGTPFDTMIRSASLCRQMGAHLASIHRVDVGGLALPGAGEDPKVGVAADIAFIEQNWRRIGKPDIVVECALDWLKANIDLASGASTLVHGDYGAHNLLQEDGTIEVVLDWEFAKIGNPVDDLGFVLPVAELVDSWDSFMAGYVEAGGNRPADDQLNFFVILGRTRLAIMVSQTHDIFRRHGHFAAGVPGAILQPRLLADLGQLILAQG